MVRVAGGTHPFCKEETSLLCFCVVGEGTVALLGEAGGVLAGLVVGFGFAIGEEAAVLLSLSAP